MAVSRAWGKLVVEVGGVQLIAGRMEKWLWGWLG